MPQFVRFTRRLPAGAEISNGIASFRIWAPASETAELVIGDGQTHSMTREGGGYYSIELEGLKTGTRYGFRLFQLTDVLADPASRYQPDGPAGLSELVDPSAYIWKAKDWSGIGPLGQVLYEMHIGTFTPEGTWASAVEKLDFLREIGVTCIELMPINEFSGAFGWGYDGTHPYAPTRVYGKPDDVRAFVDAAHNRGIGVILDVVYNHFGVGERLRDFSPDYFTDRYWNEWGSSINFDGENSLAVREFVGNNAAYWIDEFRFDGLRLDATQALDDSSEEHIMAMIGRKAREAAAGRSILLVAENEPQDTRLVRPAEKGGYGLDSLWNDDFHHSAVVALTGRNEAYYHDHHGTAQEFISSAKYGYLFQGQRYDWQDGARGKPGFDLTPPNFVHFLQNHDQVANSGTGARMTSLGSPAKVRALTALLLLGPQTPMLFQGQEFGATTPFHYFADQQGDLVEIVRKGRVDSLVQFPSLKDPNFSAAMPAPADPTTFQRSKLDWNECARNGQAVALHRDLLTLRREHLAFSTQPSIRDGCLDGCCLSPDAFLLRYFTDFSQDERLLVVNLGRDLGVASLADPLIAPPFGMHWDLVWSSEDFSYGGSGKRQINLESRFVVSGETALVFAPAERGPQRSPDREEMKAWQDAISG